MAFVVAAFSSIGIVCVVLLFLLQATLPVSRPHLMRLPILPTKEVVAILISFLVLVASLTSFFKSMTLSFTSLRYFRKMLLHSSTLGGGKLPDCSTFCLSTLFFCSFSVSISPSVANFPMLSCLNACSRVDGWPPPKSVGPLFILGVLLFVG